MSKVQIVILLMLITNIEPIMSFDIEREAGPNYKAATSDLTLRDMKFCSITDHSKRLILPTSCEFAYRRNILDEILTDLTSKKSEAKSTTHVEMHIYTKMHNEVRLIG